jgi:hypothetical protein
MINMVYGSRSQGRAIAQTASYRGGSSSFRDSPCGIFGELNNSGLGFSPSPSVFFCQYHSTTAALYSPNTNSRAWNTDATCLPSAVCLPTLYTHRKCTILFIFIGCWPLAKKGGAVIGVRSDKGGIGTPCPTQSLIFQHRLALISIIMYYILSLRINFSLRCHHLCFHFLSVLKLRR